MIKATLNVTIAINKPFNLLYFKKEVILPISPNMHDTIFVGNKEFKVAYRLFDVDEVDHIGINLEKEEVDEIRDSMLEYYNEYWDHNGTLNPIE